MDDWLVVRIFTGIKTLSSSRATSESGTTLGASRPREKEERLPREAPRMRSLHFLSREGIRTGLVDFTGARRNAVRIKIMMKLPSPKIVLPENMAMLRKIGETA
jgi:hypothetical protein